MGKRQLSGTQLKTIRKDELEMEEGYFFCGDLLGFSKIVANLESNLLQDKINEWIALVEETAEKHSINFKLISDTVFASVKNPKDLTKLVAFVRDLWLRCKNER